MGISSTGEHSVTPPAPGLAYRLGRILLVFCSSPESGSTMTEHGG